MKSGAQKVVVKNSSLRVKASSPSNKATMKMPIKVVHVNEAGRQGPKGDPGLSIEEIDQRIDEKLNENKILFRDLAGNIYGTDS